MKKLLFIYSLMLPLLATTLIVKGGSRLPKNHLQSNTSLKLYVFDCGHIDVRDLSLFNPNLAKGSSKELANPCYLIKHPQGMLLWDTGLNDQLITKKNGIKVLNGALNMFVVKTLLSQLKEINVKTENINYLAFSHLHNDHTGNAKLFLHSTWLMQKAEFDISHSKDAINYGYKPQDYVNTKAKIKKLAGDFDVFGDGSVIIISTPGHSVGHQSLLVNLTETGAVLLSGDLYHFKENRDNYAMPGWNNKKQTIHSFALIDDLLAKNKATLWIHHDKEEFDQLKKSPYFYQ